jgi:hypothetical protein
MDKLNQLIARCKRGVYVSVNSYRDIYLSFEQACEELPEDVGDEVRAGMLRSGNIVEVQFYPDTPIGFYRVVHWDLDEALRLSLECLDSVESPGRS